MSVYYWLLVFGVTLYLNVSHVEPWNTQGVPDPSFSSYSVIYPKLIDGRNKREISSTREMSGHKPNVTVAFYVSNKRYILDLDLNRNVVSKNSLLRYQHNGTFLDDKRALIDDDNCYYSGIVRGTKESTVALTTCDGISGMVFDGRRTLFVSPSPEATSDPGSGRAHYLYSEHDLTQNRTCGVPDHDAPHLPARRRRSPEVRSPRASDAKSRYVELALVVDHKVYQEGGEDLQATVRRTKQIANIVNALYAPLNIFVALVGVEVWTEKDEIVLSENGDTTLNSFLHYRSKRLVRDMPNDNAQLLTGIEFQGGVVGKALKGPICTLEFSGGVNMDHSKQVSLVATTVAHEMGHNFGMEHDSDKCECKEDRCIMSPSSSSVSPTHWSSCSLHYLAQAFGHGMDYCLRNQPASLYDSPVCGNGFLEPGEQCDCGLPGDCSNLCCNPSTCMLRPNATCASGHCCDISVCALKRPGIKCRAAEHECDLSEYCTGNSEHCPDDRHTQDGHSCHGGESYCYDGVCRTRDEQCRLIWGMTGSNSVDSCYVQNSKGTRLGNCGYDLLSRNYTRCRASDVMCGRLHCAHLSEKLEFGMESAAIISATFINMDNKVVPCRTAIIDLGLGSRDPGLVPNGAPCGHRKMCVEQRCVPVSSVVEGLCSDGCSGNGVCNDRGHCHCNSGWGSPFCDAPGDGGSVDSGPALDESAGNEFVIVLFVVFLGLVPAAALIFCCLYFRRYNISVKEAFMLPSLASISRKLSGGGGGGKRREQGRKKAAAGRRASVGLLELTGRADNLSTGSDRDAVAPLTQSQTDRASPRDQLASNLLGTFTGFSIKPIRSENGGTGAVSPPGGESGPEPRRVCEVKPTVKRPVPQKPPPPMLKGPQAARTTFDMKPPADGAHKPTAPAAPPAEPPPQGARTTFGMKPHIDHVTQKAVAEPVKPARPAAAPAAAAVPPVAVVNSRTTFGMSQRPGADKQPQSERSSAAETPVTQPDKTVSRTTFLSRGAGRPPPSAAETPTGNVASTAASAPVSPTAPLSAPVPARPVSVVAPLESVPDARTVHSEAGSKSSTLDSNRSDTLRSTGSDGGRERDSARFGGTLSRVSGIFKRVKTPGSPDPGDRSNHLPNQSFKAAKIDRDRLRNMEISAPIPQSVQVPESAVPVGSAPASPQPGVGTASPAGTRAALTAAQEGIGRAGRPVSYPARPTAPPPPRPPPAPVSPPHHEDVYDDCNLGKPAPSDEHFSESSDENIYSTIEERPEEEHLYALPPDEDPDDGGDLLSEIAAELQSKDLYAAVDKNRPRQVASPVAELYQNVGEVQNGGGAATKGAPPDTAAAALSKPVPPAKPDSRRPKLPEKPPITARKPQVKRPPFK